MLYLEKFKIALRWNFIESSYYQLLLILHYYVLHHVAAASLFKIMGPLFALVYSLRTIVELGIEPDLASNFANFSRSQPHLKNFLIARFLKPCTLFFFPILCATGLFFYPLLIAHSWLLVVMLTLQLILEVLKKVLKIVIGLAFLNKQIAYIESWSISAYLGLFWLGYAFGAPLSIEYIFGLYLCTLSITTLWFSSLFYSWYKTLPKQGEDSIIQLHTSTRLYGFAYQVINMLFSGNFLVPFFALQCTSVDPGIFYLANTLTYSINRIIRHTFGYSSQALFATIKGERENSFSALQISTRYLYHALAASLFGCGLLYCYSFVSHTAALMPLTLLALFFLVQFLENGMVALDQFLLVFDHARFILYYTVATFLCIVPIWYYASSCGPLNTLTLLFILRSCCVMVMNWLVMKKRNSNVWHRSTTSSRGAPQLT
jgi:hypothetical protein